MDYANKKEIMSNNINNDEELIIYTKGKKCQREEFTNSHWNNVDNYIFKIDGTKENKPIYKISSKKVKRKKFWETIIFRKAM